MNDLRQFHRSVIVAITAYFKYLKETETRAEESYLTKWIDNEPFNKYEDEIDYFLQPEV